REVTAKAHVVANEDAVADGERQAHGLIVRVPKADRETTAAKRFFQVHHAKHLHAVRGDGVFIAHDGDLAKAERLDDGLYNVNMGNGFVGFSPLRSSDEGQIFPADFLCAAMRHEKGGSGGRCCLHIKLLSVFTYVKVVEKTNGNIGAVCVNKHT